jgi:hypothetical protein
MQLGVTQLRRRRPDFGNWGGRMPPEFAHKNLATIEIDLGTHLIEPETAVRSGS